MAHGHAVAAQFARSRRCCAKSRRPHRPCLGRPHFGASVLGGRSCAGPGCLRRSRGGHGRSLPRRAVLLDFEIAGHRFLRLVSVRHDRLRTARLDDAWRRPGAVRRNLRALRREAVHLRQFGSAMAGLVPARTALDRRFPRPAFPHGGPGRRNVSARRRFRRLAAGGRNLRRLAVGRHRCGRIHRAVLGRAARPASGRQKLLLSGRPRTLLGRGNRHQYGQVERVACRSQTGRAVRLPIGRRGNHHRIRRAPSGGARGPDRQQPGRAARSAARPADRLRQFGGRNDGRVPRPQRSAGQAHRGQLRRIPRALAELYAAILCGQFQRPRPADPPR